MYAYTYLPLLTFVNFFLFFFMNPFPSFCVWTCYIIQVLIFYHPSVDIVYYHPGVDKSLSRCGDLSRIAWSSSHLPLELLPRPLPTVSPFFVALAGKKLSGKVMTIQKKLFVHVCVFFFFRNNFSNFNTPVKFRGMEFQGPLWSPMRLFPNIVFFLFVLVVPGLYGSIYRFRQKHATTTLGWYQTYQKLL